MPSNTNCPTSAPIDLMTECEEVVGIRVELEEVVWVLILVFWTLVLSCKKLTILHEITKEVSTHHEKTVQLKKVFS